MVTARQLNRNEWREYGGEVWLCTFPFMPRDFSQRVSLSFVRELDQLGEIELAVARVDGDIVRFEARPPTTGPVESQFVTAVARGDVENLERLLENLCELVRVERSELLWLQSDLSPRPWALYRLDDNGNRFLMSFFRDRAFAEQTALVFEQRGHKQTYIVEPALRA
jgi:hypothetical protein